MKKIITFLLLLICVFSVYAAKEKVSINYFPNNSSEMVLQSINGSKSGFYLGYFTIKCQNSSVGKIKISSPSVRFIELQGKKDGKIQTIEFDLKGDLHIQNNSTIIKSVNFADGSGFEYKFYDNRNTYVLDLYLEGDVAFDKLDGNYILVGDNELNKIVINSITTEKFDLVINGGNTSADIKVCPIEPTVNEKGETKTGVSTDPNASTSPVVVTPLINTSFTDMNDNTINESTYSLDYYAMHNAYYKAPVVKAKISIQNSDNSQNLNKFSQMYEVEISSNGAFTNSSGSTSISYDLITEIGSTNMSVVQGSKQHSYKLSSLETNDYAYFPIYFNFGSPDKLRNALAGVYTDNVKVVITPLE